jgi:hypothetical protein
MQINRTFAVFNFDGTITTSDSRGDCIRHAIGCARFALGVLLALPSLVGTLIGICDGVLLAGFQNDCSSPATCITIIGFVFDRSVR